MSGVEFLGTVSKFRKRKKNLLRCVNILGKLLLYRSSHRSRTLMEVFVMYHSHNHTAPDYKLGFSSLLLNIPFV